ncbi:MAG: putative DNA binding domain-containing protein [Oscillospiraceae bacterium]|nr:putative DNA binding domain-containing protein [Oscillospiraceae bacterium]
MFELTESESVELKSTLTDSICKEIIAFANTCDGKIYLGVADNGNIVGINNPDQMVLQINNMVRDSIKPDVTMFLLYEVKTVEEKQIIVITIQKGVDRPYYLAAKGLRPSGVYVRNGNASDPSSDTAIRKMIKETDGDRFEDMRSLEQQLTFDAAKEMFQSRQVTFDTNSMKTLGLLTREGIYSNTALLISDQCPSTIKAATFSGKDKEEFQDRREFSGSLFRQMKELYAYLDLRNQTKATFEGLYRVDKRAYPEVALREALMNAIVHRDYSFSASTLVSVYDDRIEFVSIGGLPDGVEIDDILLGLSVCRNPKLAAIFYRLELIEAYGTGMQRIMKAYQGCAITPGLEVTHNAFKIVLPNRNTDNAQPAADEQERSILNYLDQHESLVRSEVDQLLDVSQATSSRILKKMLSEGVIIQVGKGRKTKYKRKNGSK